MWQLMGKFIGGIMDQLIGGSSIIYVQSDDDDKSVECNQRPFAEGRFRRVHMGKWVRPESKEGQQCVVKHLKQSYTWRPTDWHTTEKIYNKAQELAFQFNRSTQTNKPIIFTDVTVMRCTKTDPTSAGPGLNEYIVVEDFIAGRYIKWCNNYGSWSPQCTPLSMQAFVHWSWYHSKGKKMVADLQGVRYYNGYTLTDPAILSLTPNKYGCTDTGPEGMALMLLTHTCNSMCDHLPNLTEWDLLFCLNEQELKRCKEQIHKLRYNATIYPRKLNLSTFSQRRLAAKLQEIATRINYNSIW